MNQLPTLEDQIRRLADAEFRVTEPIVFEQDDRQEIHWWFASAVAAIVLIVMLFLQFGRRDAAIETPVADDAVVSIDAASIPETLRTNLGSYESVTRGDTAIFAGSDELWATVDRGRSWTQAELPTRLQRTWCSGPDAIATMHRESFALVASASGLADDSPVRRSLYLSDGGLQWREVALPRSRQTDDAATCGVASDGETLVVSRATVTGQVELLVDAEGAGVFESRVIPSPDLAFGRRPLVRIYRESNRWLTAYCSVQPATEERCVWDVADVSAVVDDASGASVPVLDAGRADALYLSSGVVWRTGIAEAGSDYNLGSELDAYGAPWVAGAGDNTVMLPAGLSIGTSVTQIGGEAVAVVRGRSGRDSAGRPLVERFEWFVLRDGSWREVEPIAMTPWSAWSGDGDFDVRGWEPELGLVGWPTNGSVELLPAAHPMVDASAETIVTASIGHVEVAASVDNSLLYRTTVVGDWRVIDPVATFGPGAEAVVCVGADDHRFVVKVSMGDLGFQRFRSQSGLDWQLFADTALPAADASGSPGSCQ